MGDVRSMYGVRTAYRACTDVRYGTGVLEPVRTYILPSLLSDAIGVPTLCIAVDEVGLLKSLLGVV